MNRIKNILVFLALWAISYYFGVTLGAAYDNVWTGNDLVAIISGLAGIVYAFKAVHNV